LKCQLTFATGVMYLALAASAGAQSAPLSFLPSVDSHAVFQSRSSCKPLEMQSAAELTLHQRTCFYAAKLMTPSLALRAALSTGFGRMDRNPELRDNGASAFARRFALYYARESAQSAGELLGGYLNREDPRFHGSERTGFWNRTRDALLNTVLAHRDDGASSLALAPIAGSLSSGMITLATYRNHDTLGDGLRRSGFAYGAYVSTALMNEFQPDLKTWANHLLHPKH